VGVTEHRIQFKEVQLREKSREQSGELDTPDSVAPTNDVPPGDGGQALGRMIGSITDLPQRKRKKGRNKERDASPEEGSRDDAMDTS
jgi:hypothetical protein